MGEMVVFLVDYVIWLVGLILGTSMFPWVLLRVPLVGVHHFLLLLGEHVGSRVVVHGVGGAMRLWFGFLAHS
jgi:hypothetical protein